MASDHQAPVAHDAADAALAPPADDVNPALLDLDMTFTLTMILTALFVGTVIVFILL